MNSLKYGLKCNIYLWSIIKRIVFSFSKKEKEYQKFVKEIEKVDSIENYAYFKEKIQKMLFSSEIQSSRKNGDEGEHYGHYNALINYADYEKSIISLIPSIEHGIRFGTKIWDYEKTLSCYACQGKIRTNEIHAIDLWKPVFSLGPYIHYADSYYLQDTFLKKKERAGKILLVFPAHTWEGDSFERNESFVDLIYKKYSKYFDSVMICVYWHDVNDILMDLFKERGATLVSAGFRGDKNFIRRLKSIIQLADTVVVDGIGTNIGYCIYMGKPVYLEGTNIDVDDEYYLYNQKRFQKAFYSDTLNFTKEQIKMQELLYKEFWGGSACIKSVDEMRTIFELLEEIYQAAYYDVRKMPEVIQKKLEIWRKSNRKLDNMKYHLLSDSLMGL